MILKLKRLGLLCGSYYRPNFNFVNGDVENMFEKITETLSSNDDAAEISQRLQEWATVLNNYFSGADNLRIFSII